MKIYIWQLKPSMHQVALVKALKEISDVTWIMQEMELTSERKQMGWQDGGLKPDVNLKIFPEMKEFISTLNSDTIHLFGGFNASKDLNKALKFCLSKGMNVYVQSESYQYNGIRGKIRTIMLRIDYQLYYKNKLEGVFAIGDLGVNFFTKKMGFPNAKVFPFGYFTEKPKNIICLPKSSDFRIIFVGQLIKRKGIDLLIKSCSTLKGNWNLDIVGDGPLMEHLQECANKIDSDRIHFLNTLPNTEVQELMAQGDLLVLPSRWDGWGAVVNEALMNGTPVLATEMCGSSILLQDSSVGDVIKSHSAESLHHALQRRINLGKISKEERRTIKEWSHRLTGDSAAAFVQNVFNGSITRNTWLK